MNEITTPVGKKLKTDIPYRNRPMSWLRSEIDRLFDDLVRPGPGIFDFAPRFDVNPAVELVEDADGYRVTAELPGLTDKDVNVTISDGVLTIAGEKRDERQEKKNGCLIDERRYGSFEKQLLVPADAKVDGVKARFKDGVLTIALAKDVKATPAVQKIEIEA